MADVAKRFVSAVQAKQGEQACSVLTQTGAQSVSGATDASCADAVLNVDENGTVIHGVQVWSDDAQVKIGTDVVFLRRYSSGWKVRAAGCQPQPDAAYQCDVDG